MTPAPQALSEPHAEPVNALVIGETGTGLFVSLVARLEAESRKPQRVADLEAALAVLQTSWVPFRVVALASLAERDRGVFLAVLDLLAAPAEPTLALLPDEPAFGPQEAQARGIAVRRATDAMADPKALHPEPPAATQGQLLAAIGGSAIAARFQPKVSLADGRILGFEALIRWRHPAAGFVSTDRFIAAIEAAGLSAPLAERFAPLALAPFSEAQGNGLEDATLALNVPLEVLLEPGLSARLGQAADAARVARGRVIVELTEGQIAHDLDDLRRASLALRDAGFGLALDDLGQEQDRRSELIGSLFTEVKLDRSLLAPGLSVERLTLRDRLVSQARGAGITVVAEGVESPALADRAREAGAQVIQGWWVGRPMAGSDLPAWAAAWQGGTPRAMLLGRAAKA